MLLLQSPPHTHTAIFNACNSRPTAQGRLLELVTRWLREEAALARAARGPRPTQWDPSKEGVVAADFSYAFNNGWVPGTMSSSLSTNAVMRN